VCGLTTVTILLILSVILGVSFTGFNIKENLQRANSHQSQGENLLTKKPRSTGYTWWMTHRFL
jgi:uncharacterized membrane protein